jgi:sugar O-acyltransferase (sialic acid O-acetyltransferase NeuD family)
MTGRLAILGAGDHGRVVADCAGESGWHQIDFFDAREVAADRLHPWSWIGSTELLLERVADYDGIVVGIGNNVVRLDWTRRLTAAGGRIVSIVHPRATLSRHARLQPGCVLCPGAIVNIGARIGMAGIVNSGASVDHDCVLDDGVHVAPGARLAGGVRVGATSWIGIGAIVREYVQIGAGALVGAGAVVVRPVADGLTVTGNPARPMGKPN